MQDLPSFVEMARQIQGAKILTIFIARPQRKNLLQVEREMDRLARVVDDFYERLGPRNWIFHDSLSVAEVETILAETTDSEAAEDRLISLYRDPEKTKWWTKRLSVHDGFRERFHQIQRARDHYGANQFDSCVLQLIAVMDGFVNDFEPSVRKGLASRDPDEMTAWDSVVGHHLGLTHVMKTFTKTIKKRVDEEAFEVYRHGIMHGSIVNFDNPIVATKAWNMLFAVADWAVAMQKAAKPQEAQPSLRATLSTLKRSAAYKKYQQEFETFTITPSDPGFENEDLVLHAEEFLSAWECGQWGLVARVIPAILRGTKSDGEAACFAKETFEQYEIKDWEILAVSSAMASTAEIDASVIVNGEKQQIRFRMILQTPDGTVAMPSDDGAAWRLAVWAPHTFFPETI